MNPLDELIRVSLQRHGLQRKKMPWWKPWRIYVSGDLEFYCMFPKDIKNWFVYLPSENGEIQTDAMSWETMQVLNRFKEKADKPTKKMQHEAAIDRRARELLDIFKNAPTDVSGDLKGKK